MLRPHEVINLGGYPTYRAGEDLGLWLKVVKADLKIHQLADRGITLPVHPNQNSKATRGIRLEEYAQIVNECWSDAKQAESA